MIAHNRDGAGLHGGAERQPPGRPEPGRVTQDTAGVRRVRDRLAASGHSVLQQIELELVRGRLVLRGTVPSFYLKQLAQHAARRVPEVTEIDNRLEVQRA